MTTDSKRTIKIANLKGRGVPPGIILLLETRLGAHTTLEQIRELLDRETAVIADVVGSLLHEDDPAGEIETFPLHVRELGQFGLSDTLVNTLVAYLGEETTTDRVPEYMGAVGAAIDKALEQYMAAARMKARVPDAMAEADELLGRVEAATGGPVPTPTPAPETEPLPENGPDPAKTRPLPENGPAAEGDGQGFSMTINGTIEASIAGASIAGSFFYEEGGPEGPIMAFTDGSFRAAGDIVEALGPDVEELIKRLLN